MTEPNFTSQDPQSSWSSEGPPDRPRSTNAVGDTQATGREQAHPSDSDDWETVQFPNSVDVEAIPQAAGGQPAQANPPIPRQEEMLKLIRDLNQCNDALLSRVAELEDALECSQSALQKEVERSQHSQGTSSAEAKAILSQQQQQVAQLLSELDVANDALRRTTIHNETLQAELDASQQRVAQLERECTLLQQRFGDKSSALQQAEATCRDLRSRLQRQQRYTLQFKAALEKCLNMSSSREAVAEGGDFSDSPVDGRPHPLAMPKSQQIQPWTSTRGTVPSPTGLDNMLKELRQPKLSTPAASTSSKEQPSAVGEGSPMLGTSGEGQPASDPEAETQLWQDLERVVETSVSAQAATPEQKQPPSADANPGFTEPSPWGGSMPSPEPQQAPKTAAEVAQPPSVPVASPAASAAKSGLVMPPTMKAQTPSGAAPSPVVYPLRPTKKLKSIAAVQLPSFPRSQQRSS